MKIRVLGCSGAIAAGSRTTAFLVDHDVLVDAGTGVGDLSLDELAQIDHILVSHSHLDHILSIALLADSVMRVRRGQGRGPIQVHALPETIQALKTHIFNGVIWPDFTRLPSVREPALVLSAIHVGQRLSLGDKTFEVLSAATLCLPLALPWKASKAGGSTPATPARTPCCGSGWPTWRPSSTW